MTMNNRGRWLRPVANALRALTQHLDPIPPSPTAPTVGQDLAVLLHRIDGSILRVNGTVNVVQGNMDGSITYLAVEERGSSSGEWQVWRDA